jgi:hypothetical protein
MMQTAVIGAKYRCGFPFIFNLWIEIDMMSQVPAGGALQSVLQNPVRGTRGVWYLFG